MGKVGDTLGVDEVQTVVRLRMNEILVLGGCNRNVDSV